VNGDTLRHRNAVTGDEASDMSDTNHVTVRLFSSLRALYPQRGDTFTYDVPAEGMIARDIATDLGIDPKHIEGVFVNHKVHGVGYTVHPGDRIAFVPYDIPGPHRVYLGLYDAGKNPDA